MAAGIKNIYIEQGATYRLNITWKDSGGTPIDLTGYTARMQVRHSYKSDTVLLNFTTENGAITLGGAAGTITIVGLATLTEDVPAKAGVWDLELVDGDGNVTRLLQGAVEVSPEVTR